MATLEFSFYIEIMENRLKEFKDSQEQLDVLYPNRHIEIHKSPCKHCPSHINKINGAIDPESSEIKTYSKEIIVKEFLFVCAWRNSKLCKGLCDYMEIDEEFIKSVKK